MDSLPLTKRTKFLEGLKLWDFAASSLTPRLSPLCSWNCSKRLPACLFPFIMYIYVQWYDELDLHIRLTNNKICGGCLLWIDDKMIFKCCHYAFSSSSKCCQLIHQCIYVMCQQGYLFLTKQVFFATCCAFIF